MRIAAALILGSVLVSGQAPHAFSFDAASIKPNNSGSTGSDSDSDGGRLSMRNVTLKRFIQIAYGIPESQILGGPKWIESNRYDIEAKAVGLMHDEDMKVMMRNLLTERFHLTLHSETKPLAGYALVVGKGGIKAKPGAFGSSSNTRGRRGHLEAQGCSMAKLAIRLSAELKLPVADMTGTTGGYDFTLDWTPEELLVAAQPDLASGPSIFTALQEQLGLKLESRKVPVDLLVVDGAELPSEN
jgi:uncharacterized protein (TIGR03435 family)